MRPAIPRLAPAPYPSTTKAITYAEDYRVNCFCKTGDPKGFHVFNHSRFIDITACGGKNNYFIVYAYPPAGFWYGQLGELELIEPWRGWIFLYHPPTQTYKVIVNTKNDGYTAFEEIKQAIGL